MTTVSDLWPACFAFSINSMQPATLDQCRHSLVDNLGLQQTNKRLINNNYQLLIADQLLNSVGFGWLVDDVWACAIVVLSVNVDI